MKCPECGSENVEIVNNKLDCVCADCQHEFNYEIDIIFKGDIARYGEAKAMCEIMCRRK